MGDRKRHVILVLGMHRGGTSAIARGLSAIGVDLGDNLLPPGADNPKGFWEDVEYLKLNEELLRHFHSAYDRLGLAWSFSDHDAGISALKVKAVQFLKRRISDHAGVWGFKDPRASRLVPFWRPVIEACGCTVNYVIALRNPLSVALSLEKRNQIPVEKSYFLWLQHMIPAVLGSAGSRRVVVDYDLLIDAPLLQLSRMSSRLGLKPTDREPSASAEYEQEFLERGLRHTEFSCSDLALDGRVPEHAITVYRLLLSGAKDEIDLDATEIVERFNEVDTQLKGFASAFSYANSLEEDRTALYRSIAERDRQDAFLGRALTEHQGEITALKQARSDLEAQVEVLRRMLSERDVRDTSLQQISAERERQVTSLQLALAECDRRIELLNRAISAVEGEKTSFQQMLSERDLQVASLKQALSVREESICALSQVLGARNQEIGNLSDSLSAQSEKTTSLEQAVSEREEHIASLHQGASERAAQINNLNATLSEREGQIAYLYQAASERDAQINSLNSILSDRQAQIASLRNYVSALKASMSWRLTALLRYIYDLLQFGREVSADYVARLRRWPGLAPSRSKHAESVPAHLMEARTSKEGMAEYVEDSPSHPHFIPSVRLVAFYLPQFHPIPENDEWWGKGFTEWTNVVGAKAQFHGHYQPHLPGELGFYDLRVDEVQMRQVELAKRYGIGAFCFYLYWFGGKRLLELPVRRYLDNPELSLPFCLCWANENWTRRWNGLDDEVLIAQDHNADDDIAFIRHVSQYMRDPRYLRVNGRPVLLVYRPSLLPDVRATVGRWREWARQNDLAELYLVYPQSFETCDPAEYDFDAATEFPPNLSGPPVLTNSVSLCNPKFSGIVYDWRILVERSRRYRQPSYQLFRGVCPSWDNEPRHPGRGTIFLHSSPEGYQEWLENAAADTHQRLQGDERLVFVNAWNEWAEGAHLEPDRRYGYAWLRATREALRAPDTAHVARVVVVTHDAYPHGGQYIALNVVRELCALRCEVEVVCLGDGPLKADFAKCGRLHDLSGVDAQGPEARELAADLFRRGFLRAIVNTTVCGLFLATLKQAGLRCVALIHELREIILSYKLQKHALEAAKHADYVVFPAAEVRDAFADFASVGQAKAIVRPQGLLKRNVHVPGGLAVARRALRMELALPDDARIILAVGYADLRKGVDYFVDIAAQIVDQDPKAQFVWVGHGDADEQRRLAARAKLEPSLFRHIHFIGRRDDTALYYAGADVFALTSREDPFPCVVLEAMDVGLPIVAFAGSGGSNALVGQGLGENVPMGDTAAFARSIQRLLSDGEERERIAGLARALIAERFSMRHYVFDLLDLAGVNLRKVSVVVPNYNYGRYLADRIATILKQTYPIFELIFLDDASSDHSVALAKGLLADTGVEYQIVTNRTNSGSVSLQWKLGAELARGDVVWIAEADDLSHPDFLATVLKGFDDPEVVLSYCESRQIDRDGRVLADNYREYVADLGWERWQRAYTNDGGDEIRSYLAVKNTIPNVSAVLMLREKLMRVLSENIEDIRLYKVAGDWKTYLHLLPGARLAYVPQPLNLHRRHQQGVTIGSSNEPHYREIREIQEWVAKRYVLGPGVSTHARRYLGALRDQFGLRHSKEETVIGRGNAPA